MLLARIRESDCVGCTKCLAACPVDAIVGAQGMMHTILPEVCIGCRLCVEPCPMDCIEIMAGPVLAVSEKRTRAQSAKQHYQQRQRRLSKTRQQQLLPPDTPEYQQRLRNDIQAAMARVSAVRKQKQDLNIWIDPE